MADYKAAKEAFVADNPGEGIWAIQRGTLVALSAYTLYAVLSRRSRRINSRATDYLTVVFPLLVGVTVLSNRPWLLNGIVLALAGLIYQTLPPTTREASAARKRSTGKFLDDSDSDEEPAQPVSAVTTATSTSLSRATSSPLSPPSPVDSVPSSASPLSSPIALEPPERKRTFKRRHSPSPSTSHTAINILSSPQDATFGSDTPSQSAKDSSKTAAAQSARGGTANRLPFLSVYRSHMMLMTVHCILAVDFPIFPRVFGKCEDFGTSLMDVGVGSFVLSLGLVSVRAYASRRPSHLAKAALQALRKASPLLLLGFIRVLTVKASDYPEHVTEYGVHWNFFFTLGSLPVLGAVVAPLRNSVGWSTLAIFVGGAHQVALSRAGLQNWVMSPSRVGLLGMNKEGLVSLPGYLSIYLFGLALGELVLRRGEVSVDKRSQRVSETVEEHEKTRAERRRGDLAMELFGYAVAFWVLLAAWQLSGGQVSRRMANLPYVLWTAAYNTTFILGYLIVEIAFFRPGDPHAVPALLEAVNKNSLAVFIAANLLTGLINLTTETMYASDTWAMSVLVVYSIGTCALAWVVRGTRLKI